MLEYSFLETGRGICLFGVVPEHGTLHPVNVRFLSRLRTHFKRLHQPVKHGIPASVRSLETTTHAKSCVKLAREEYNVELERQKAHQGYTSSAKGRTRVRLERNQALIVCCMHAIF